MARVAVGNNSTYEITFKDQDNAVIDISTASTKQIKFKPPNNGDLITKAGTFTVDGENGKLRYVDTAGDIAVAGTWRLQGHVVISSKNWYSSIEEFEMEESLS